MSALLVVLSVCLFALVAGVAVKKQNLIQATPSLVWFALMTLPFIFEWRFFPSSPRTDQSIGLLVISTALAVGDLTSLKIKRREIRESEKMNSGHSRIFYFLSALVFAIPVFHYWKAGTIPIIYQFFGNFTKSEVALERENFGKLLQMPYLFKVLVNWISLIFGPLLVIWFYSLKKYWFAAGIFVWVLFYASASTADGPIVTFFWLIAFGIIHKTFKLKSLGNLITSGLTLGLIFIVISGVMLGTSAIDRSKECSVVAEVGFTPGDVLRSCEEASQISLNPVMDRLGYRFFLTPIEVSNHWYDYFDGDPSGNRDLVNMFERDLSKQASNKVGNWAYVTKFPESYPKTISANSSLDADAFSFYGLFSVFIAAFILLLIRVFIVLTSKKPSEFELILEGFALGMLAFFPVTAPIQAILFPQGLGLVILILFIFRIQNILRIFSQRRYKVDKSYRYFSSGVQK
jgi:hypothetical protein